MSEFEPDSKLSAAIMSLFYFDHSPKTQADIVRAITEETRYGAEQVIVTLKDMVLRGEIGLIDGGLYHL